MTKSGGRDQSLQCVPKSNAAARKIMMPGWRRKSRANKVQKRMAGYEGRTSDGSSEGGPSRHHRRRPGRPGGGVHVGSARLRGHALREESLARRQGGDPRRAGLSLRHGADHPDPAFRAAPHLRRGRQAPRRDARSHPLRSAMALLLPRRHHPRPGRRGRDHGPHHRGLCAGQIGSGISRFSGLVAATALDFGAILLLEVDRLLVGYVRCQKDV